MKLEGVGFLCYFARDRYLVVIFFQFVLRHDFGILCCHVLATKQLEGGLFLLRPSKPTSLAPIRSPCLGCNAVSRFALKDGVEDVGEIPADEESRRNVLQTLSAAAVKHNQRTTVSFFFVGVFWRWWCRRWGFVVVVVVVLLGEYF